MSSKSKGPIKFSTDPDLNTSECYDLLDEFTPPHMKKNKASLKLFIRCVCWQGEVGRLDGYMCVCSYWNERQTRHALCT